MSQRGSPAPDMVCGRFFLPKGRLWLKVQEMFVETARRETASSKRESCAGGMSARVSVGFCHGGGYHNDKISQAMVFFPE